MKAILNGLRRATAFLRGAREATRRRYHRRAARKATIQPEMDHVCHMLATNMIKIQVGTSTRSLPGRFRHLLKGQQRCPLVHKS